LVLNDINHAIYILLKAIFGFYVKIRTKFGCKLQLAIVASKEILFLKLDFSQILNVSFHRQVGGSNKNA